jgi:hypothetical protein
MHTQGPLEIDLGALPSIVVVAADLGDIAEFFSREEHSVGASHEEALANARLFVAAADLLALVNDGLSLKGGWREAIVELEDFCSEPVRLRNMIMAASQLDRWANTARAIIARATER